MATKARVGRNGNLTPAPRRSYQKPQTSTPDVRVVREPAAYQGVQMAEEVTPYQMIQEYDPAVDAALIHSWEEAAPAESYLDDFGIFDIFQEGGTLPKKPIVTPYIKSIASAVMGNNTRTGVSNNDQKYIRDVAGLIFSRPSFGQGNSNGNGFTPETIRRIQKVKLRKKPIAVQPFYVPEEENDYIKHPFIEQRINEKRPFSNIYNT